MLKFLLKDSLMLLFLLPILVFFYFILNYQFNYFEVKAMLNFGLWGSFSLEKIENYFIFLSAFIVLFNAYFLNLIFNKNELYDKNSYIISYFYVILLSFFQTLYISDGVLLSQTFLILSINEILKFDQQKESKSLFFNVGFFIGLSITIFPMCVSMVFFVFFMINRLKTIRFKGGLLLLLGVLAPLIYAFSYQYFFYNEFVYLSYINPTKEYTQKEIIFVIALFLFSILLIISLFGIKRKTNKSAIRFRKNISIFLIFLIFALITGTIHWVFYKQYEWFSFMVISLAVFLPFSYYQSKNMFINSLMFYTFFLFSVIKFFL